MTGDRSASAPPSDEVDFVSGRTRVYGIVGADVQLHGPDEPRFAVVKIGPSPLPADRRPCVYLELG